MLVNEKGEKFYSAHEKATALARYFSRVFCKPNDFCRLLNDSCPFSCPTPPFTLSEVRKTLRNLKPSFSKTADNIPSLLLGEVPTQWKTAFVTPIPKVSLASNLSDFRPISLLPAPCKVMEKLISARLIDWFSKINALPESQHGFLPKRSTVTSLIDSYHNWVNALNDGFATEVIYFDLSKAFDTVDHNFLISKLESVGIRDNLLMWFVSYLSQRKFIVRFCHAESNVMPCTSGVPQGGVLSPLLFVIYTNEINNLLKCDPRICVNSYADDIKIFASYDSRSKDNVKNALLVSSATLCRWANEWNININLDKCQVLSIAGSPLNISLTRDTPLTSVSIAKDLGIYFENNLKFSYHIETITVKAKRAIFCLFRVVRTNDVFVFLRLYKACIIPLLEYGSQIWNPVLKKDINKIESVQKLFTKLLYYRIFPDQNYPQSLPPYRIRLQELNLKSLFYRRVVADLVFAFKILRGEVDLRPSKFWVFRPIHVRRAGFRLSICNRRGRASTTLQRSFFYRSCHLLNKLPSSFTLVPSSAAFKKILSRVDVLSMLKLPDVV